MNAALLADGIDGFGQRLSAVSADQWTAPTPCDEWDVRALVNHVVGELLWMPPLLAGQTVADVGDRFDGDVLGDNPHATFTEAAVGARAAVGEPGALESTVHLSFGDFPGSDYVAQIVSDLTVHAWDLSKAVGADDRLGQNLVEFVEGFLLPQVDAWRSAGAFGPAADPGPNPDAQANLLAQTGRSPGWTRD
jgi:uncharacterized protein (TIGR03086 family)